MDESGISIFAVKSTRAYMVDWKEHRVWNHQDLDSETGSMTGKVARPFCCCYLIYKYKGPSRQPHRTAERMKSDNL